jgi:hypothetical protein
MVQGTGKWSIGWFENLSLGDLNHLSLFGNGKKIQFFEI